MAPRPRVNREMIVEEARRIVAEEGTGALTFQALARRLEVSKQAIIYWYPSKKELVRDFCLPALKEEREAIVAALEDARSAPEAIEKFVRALVAHHLSDLGRFRMLYLWIQFEPEIAPANADEQALLDPIHETTRSVYDVLEARIRGDKAFVGDGSARRLAVAVDMAAIGLITMVAMGEAMNDPWVHSTESLVDSLVALLAGRHTSAGIAGEQIRTVPASTTRESAMADILSLSKARKTKAHAQKEQQAAANRARFGRTKADKKRETAERERADQAADAHKRDK